MTAVVYLGLGSNMAQPLQQLRRARLEIARLSGVSLLGASSLYRSAPLLAPDAAPEQDAAAHQDYINAVIALTTRWSPRRLLTALLAIERRHGRQRRYRWAPRTLDLDVLLYGQRSYQFPELTIPHPELHRRAFVLYPLYELAPRLLIPGLGPLQHQLRAVPPDALQKLRLSWRR